jgi:hypothetical protein
VFVVVADQLVLFRRGERSVWSFSPRAFHIIKSVAHAPVALYAMFERAHPATDRELEQVRERLASSRGSVADAALDEATQRALGQILDTCAELACQLSGSGKQRPLLDAFARAMGPRLLDLAEHATHLQLVSLHEHTEHALRALPPEERHALHVVVAGDHQARVRSLAMQYFQKRFAAFPDADQRVIYAEGVADEQSALALVGTQRIDRVLARTFFGEERRLQRDILGDAAERQLRSFQLSLLPERLGGGTEG